MDRESCNFSTADVFSASSVAVTIETSIGPIQRSNLRRPLTTSTTAMIGTTLAATEHGCRRRLISSFRSFRISICRRTGNRESSIPAPTPCIRTDGQRLVSDISRAPSGKRTWRSRNGLDRRRTRFGMRRSGVATTLLNTPDTRSTLPSSTTTNRIDDRALESGPDASRWRTCKCRHSVAPKSRFIWEKSEKRTSRSQTVSSATVCAQKASTR